MAKSQKPTEPVIEETPQVEETTPVVEIKPEVTEPVIEPEGTMEPEVAPIYVPEIPAQVEEPISEVVKIGGLEYSTENGFIPLHQRNKCRS